MSPFFSLMLLVGGICMIPVVYKLKLNMYRRGHYDNSSFQAGMIWAVILVCIGFSSINLMFWVIQ